MPTRTRRGANPRVDAGVDATSTTAASSAPLPVSTMLASIGLAPAVMEKFALAGIVQSADLIELETDFFEALGVTADEDRKKLFFLIQRVKLQVEKENASAVRRGSERDNGESDSGPGDDRVEQTGEAGLADSDCDDGRTGRVTSKRQQPLAGASDKNRRTSRRLQEKNVQPEAPETKLEQSVATRKRVSRMQAPQRSRRSLISSSSKIEEGPTPARESGDETSDPQSRPQSSKSSVASREPVQSKESLDYLLQSSCSDDSNEASGVMRRVEEEIAHLNGSDSRINATGSVSSKSRQRRKTTFLQKPRARKSRPSDVTSAVRAPEYTESTSFGSVVASSSSGGNGGGSNSWKDMIEDLREDTQAEYDMFAGDDAHKFEENTVMRIRVIVRKRPVSKMEANASGGGIDIIHPLDYGDYGKILVYQPKTRVDLTKQIEKVPFAYDNVFGDASTNAQIYQRSIRNLILPFFHGHWGTVFAYGQTGSGKTYTMMGSNMTGMNRRKLDGRDQADANDDESSANLGLYYLAALDIFTLAAQPEFEHLKISVSLFEIYGGKLYDLLNSRKQIKCLEDSRGKVCFPGITEHPISNPEELIDMIETGNKNRSTGTTSRNADSSRSHAVLQLNLKRKEGRRRIIEHSRLTFIDLAGSERGADTSSASRATRLEGAEINTSLLALKEVIRALASGGSMTHIPFRGSKLTQVLKDSFVGENARCCMVACVSPDIGNCEQTLNTLRYADRVKERHSETGALSSDVYDDTQTFPDFFSPSKSTAPFPVATPKPSVSRRMSIQNEEDVAKNVIEEDEAYCDSDDDLFADHADAERNSDDELVVPISRTSSSADDTVVLEGLLSTPRSSPNLIDSDDGGREIDFEAVSPFPAPSEPRVPRISRIEAGKELAKTHRSVMASMLSMVKEEMKLVNSVEEDRDRFDTYLADAYRLQQTQLEYIEQLQNAVQEYRAASSTRSGQDAPSIESDNSFEDLRDGT